MRKRGHTLAIDAHPIATSAAGRRRFGQAALRATGTIAPHLPPFLLHNAALPATEPAWRKTTSVATGLIRVALLAEVSLDDAVTAA